MLDLKCMVSQQKDVFLIAYTECCNSLSKFNHTRTHIHIYMVITAEVQRGAEPTCPPRADVPSASCEITAI